MKFADWIKWTCEIRVEGGCLSRVIETIETKWFQHQNEYLQQNSKALEQLCEKDYSPQAQWILLNNSLDFLLGIIQQ